MNSHNIMYQIHKHILASVLLSLGLASAAAQQVPFQMTYAQGAVTTSLPNASILALTAPLGQSQTIQVRATYTGTGAVTISQPAAVTGSTAFTATLDQGLPIKLTAGQTFFFTVRFSPLKATADAG